MTRLQVIGGGNMGSALVGGLIDAGWAAPAQLRVVEKDADARARLADRHPGLELAGSVAPVPDVLLAVKPGDISAVCRDVAGAGGVERVLSIAAGVTTAQLAAALGSGTAVRVVRAMPNVPALVGGGAAAIAPGPGATDADLEWAEGVLAAVGQVVRVVEAQLDAVTGLSGSGPAYVFLVAEALVEAGVLVGLARPVAETLAYQTLQGAAAMLGARTASAAELRAAVTSPGGTTAAGLRVLEQRAVRAAVIDAVAAATARSVELGRPAGGA